MCLHARADDEVPFSCSERCVEAAVKAGGQARLFETHGDHYTLIDPAAPDWAVVTDALPALLAR